MKRQFKIGTTELIHFFMPGQELDDISLKHLHNSMVKINVESGANVVNKMLDKNLSLEEIRIHLKNSIIALCMVDDAPGGFLISPILSSIKGQSIVHAGLIVISKNPGANCVGMMGYGNYSLAYEKLGKFFGTNISSTPSIIEEFVTMIPDSWPSPDVNLTVPPKGYREVVKILKDEYMDHYFPDPSQLNVNYKKFTLASNSQDMGFTTDFFKLSRSKDLKFMLFCQAWVNYSKEEDIIQVGEVNLVKYLRIRAKAFMLKRGFKKMEAIKKIESEASGHKTHDKKKAA